MTAHFVRPSGFERVNSGDNCGLLEKRSKKEKTQNIQRKGAKYTNEMHLKFANICITLNISKHIQSEFLLDFSAKIKDMQGVAVAKSHGSEGMAGVYAHTSI